MGFESLSLGYYVEEVHTVERCPHKADVVGPNPTFSNVPIVLVVSTGDCGSPGSGASPDRHPRIKKRKLDSVSGSTPNMIFGNRGFESSSCEGSFLIFWKVGTVAYCTALEKRHTSGYREFESRTFR